jgi:alpha-beta hydrolase superfamily lysophospholipase
LKTSELSVAAPNGQTIHARRWLPDGRPAAALLVVHGMAEHGARYERLARALTADSIAVYALDLPGHGQTAKEGEHGHFADRDGWRVALEAIDAVHHELAEDLRRPHEKRAVPVFLLGHSMGSFLVQHYLVEHGSRLDGAILSATTGDLGSFRPIGLTLLRIEALIRGRRHRSKLANALSFEQFNKKFKPARTDFDWLSRDPAEVDKYIADPLCGFLCSAGLWIDLLAACADLADAKRLARVPKQLPILLIAGSADPVCNGAAGPTALAQAYRGAGLKNVTTSIYEEARHELLNDTCREEVTAELRQWLVAHL